ncbi:MAG: DUF481 domain-containing protein [Planctomycetota bacterium]|nr:MAG: DUF481 domain-containing protein [Planctomycetota bacterium]
MKPGRRKRRTVGLICLVVLAGSLSTPVGAQPPWLTAPSRQGNAAGLPPGVGANPNAEGRISEHGLLQPPPPLAEQLPPSVFDEEAGSDSSSAPVVGTSWLRPWKWIPLDGWKNSAELGINGTDGNSESISFQAGTRLKRKTEITLFDLRLSHNRTYANGVERQNNALMYHDFEKFFGDSRWTFYLKNGLEYDEFKAFDLRYNINSGAGFRVYNRDDLSLTTRLGSGASREFGGPDNRWTPEVLLGVDYEHQVTKRNKLIARADYFPSWADFGDFRSVVDVAWEYLLDEDGNLSLKVGANDRYDSTPNGRKPNDINYSAMLLIKF